MIRIKVPATSANLGSGFDVMGLAIDRYNIFNFVDGYKEPEDNLIYNSYKRVFEHLGKELIPLEIRVEENVPRARGLGSSATCIVGGIMGANEILGAPLDPKEILELATEIEGHPDNVAPAIYGGLMVSVREGERIYTGKLPVKNDLEFIALVPDFELETTIARSVLPKEIPLGDGIYNVGRASMLITALITGENSLIKIGLQDKFHQSTRGKLIQGFDNIISTAYEYGALGCYLSGAGPTIMSIGEDGDSAFKEKMNAFMKDNYPGWKLYTHKINKTGAMVLKY